VAAEPPSPLAGGARSPRLGYVLAATAAALWALNGSLARFLLDDGVPAARLAEMRAMATCLALIAALAVARPAALRVSRRDLGRFAVLGIGGLAFNNALYFVGIDRLEIGVALTLQYLAPLWVLLWLRVAYGRQLPRGVWAAAGLSLAGCVLVVRAYDPARLSGAGVAAAIGSGLALATYLFCSERAGRRHAPATTLVFGFAFASLFWAVVAPVWSFPFADFASTGHLALGAYVAVLGTLVPFICIVGALRHIPASRAAVVATLEPVLAAAFAWPIHGESLAAVQVAGGLLVIAAVAWVQLQAPAGEAELAPAYAEPAALAGPPPQ
jgi:drug/metabolite transporter (DMT)-like permease